MATADRGTHVPRASGGLAPSSGSRRIGIVLVDSTHPPNTTLRAAATADENPRAEGNVDPLLTGSRKWSRPKKRGGPGKTCEVRGSSEQQLAGRARRERLKVGREGKQQWRAGGVGLGRKEGLRVTAYAAFQAVHSDTSRLQLGDVSAAFVPRRAKRDRPLRLPRVTAGTRRPPRTRSEKRSCPCVPLYF